MFNWRYQSEQIIYFLSKINKNDFSGSGVRKPGIENDEGEDKQGRSGNISFSTIWRQYVAQESHIWSGMRPEPLDEGLLLVQRTKYLHVAWIESARRAGITSLIRVACESEVNTGKILLQGHHQLEQIVRDWIAGIECEANSPFRRRRNLFQILVGIQAGNIKNT